MGRHCNPELGSLSVLQMCLHVLLIKTSWFDCWQRRFQKLDNNFMIDITQVLFDIYDIYIYIYVDIYIYRERETTMVIHQYFYSALFWLMANVLIEIHFKLFQLMETRYTSTMVTNETIRQFLWQNKSPLSHILHLSVFVNFCCISLYLDKEVYGKAITVILPEPINASIHCVMVGETTARSNRADKIMQHQAGRDTYIAGIGGGCWYTVQK